MTTPRVYVLGGYQTDFAKNWSRSGEDISTIVRDTTRGALAACDMPAPELENES